MINNETSNLNAIRFSLGFIVLCFAVFVLIIAKPLLLPLVIAIVFWYLINALAKRYMLLSFFGYNLPRFVCFVGAIATLVTGLWFVIDLIGNNINDVQAASEIYQKNFEELFDRTVRLLKLENQPSVEELASYIDVRTIAAKLVEITTSLVGKTLIVFVYVSFLLYEQSTFDNKIKSMIADEKKEERVRIILRNIDEKIQLYVWVKTLMSALTGGLSFFVLKWAGVDFAAFWALIIFFLNFIPTIGSLLGIVFPALLTLVQFDTYQQFFVVSAALSAIQMGVGNFLDPKMMGESLNLSPLVIILSLATWGTIWGIPGMFLSIPIMVIIAIMLAQFPSTRAIAVLLSKNGDVPEIE